MKQVQKNTFFNPRFYNPKKLILGKSLLFPFRYRSSILKIQINPSNNVFTYSFLPKHFFFPSIELFFFFFFLFLTVTPPFEKLSWSLAKKKKSKGSIVNIYNIAESLVKSLEEKKKKQKTLCNLPIILGIRKFFHMILAWIDLRKKRVNFHQWTDGYFSFQEIGIVIFKSWNH